MDIRIEKTDRAIEKAFMELRARQPLEKIRIKDLCTLAKVNKSTFYAHYEDIYALSDQLEKKLIEDILASVLAVKLTVAQTETLTRDLFRAFVQNRQAVRFFIRRDPGRRLHPLGEQLQKLCVDAVDLCSVIRKFHSIFPSFQKYKQKNAAQRNLCRVANLTSFLRITNYPYYCAQ